MKALAFENGSGVSIVRPIPSTRLEDETEDAWLARIADRSVPAGTSYIVVDDATLPQDRTTRAAWKIFDGAIVVDTTEALATSHGKVVASAWAEAQRRLEAGSVSLTVAGQPYSFGTDANTQANIQKAMIGVLAGITPNPRHWTPKGSAVPISITHAELAQVAGAIGAAVDANVQAYLAHKAAIRSLTTWEEVAGYDLTIGWPA